MNPDTNTPQPLQPQPQPQQPQPLQAQQPVEPVIQPTQPTQPVQPMQAVQPQVVQPQFTQPAPQPIVPTFQETIPPVAAQPLPVGKKKVPLMIIAIIAGVVALLLIGFIAMSLLGSDDSEDNSSNGITTANANSTGDVSLEKGMSKADAAAALGGLEGTCTVTGDSEMCMYKDGATLTSSNVVASVVFEAGSLKSAKVVEGETVTQSIE